MPILNLSTKIKRKGIVRPMIFTVIPYPNKKSSLSKCYQIVFKAGDKEWYLDHSLTLNSSWEAGGIWPNEQSAHKFILEKFYD